MSVRLRLIAALATLLALMPTAAAAAAADPPVNTTPPAITGQAVFGQVLQADAGAWTPPDGLTFTYQWLRDGGTIAGATGPSLTLTLADLGALISVTVTATDAASVSTSATSASVGPVARARFVEQTPPTISGVERYTRLLRSRSGRWSPVPTGIKQRWSREGDPITGATGASYRLQPEDVGKRLTLEVTVRHAGYVPETVAVRTGVIKHRVPVRRVVTYHVETRGHITADLAAFKEQTLETYRDPRGWRSAGVAFRPVSSGGSFTLVLAEASWVPRFSTACSADWSCRVGRYVIINQTRWLHASPGWHAVHRSLRDYRHMVTNHETGHWLGHGHLGCGGAGRLAPVMMQQSKGLSGCRPNPWPLASELWFHRKAAFSRVPMVG